MAPTRWRMPSIQSYTACADENNDTEYNTVLSDFNPGEALHSTEQFDAGDKLWRPTRATQHFPNDSLTGESEDSMSIEVGRGVKHAAADAHRQDSSQIVFTFGNDSQYELTGTPPVHGVATGKNVQRKPSNISAKRSTSQTARVLSDLSGKIKRQQMHDAHGHEWDDEEQLTATLSAKNTRFGNAKRSTSAAQQSNLPPRHAHLLNAADSFQLPDISGIEELVKGRQPIAHSIPLRSALEQHRARPRLAATSNRAPPVERLPIGSVPIPEDEKRIYSSLQHLRDRITQLESEKASAWSQLDDYERQVLELRSALAREEQLRRPDSALGSDDETEKDRWRMERTKLQASVRTLRQQVAQLTNKNQHATEKLTRTTNERDNLVTQLGMECFRHSKAGSEVQELFNQNAELAQTNTVLQAELDSVRQQLADGRAGQLRPHASHAGRSGPPYRTSDFHSEANKIAHTSKEPQFTLDREARQAIASIVQEQFSRLGHMHDVKSSRQAKVLPEPSRPEKHNASHTRTGHNFSQQESDQMLDDHGDFTELTQHDSVVVDALRQELQQRRKMFHSQRQSSAPASIAGTQHKQDPTAAANNTLGTGNTEEAFSKHFSVQEQLDLPKAVRVVRVQSPTLSERRRPASVAEHGGDADDHEDGDTSDIILPDITLRQPLHLADASNKVAHDKTACTVCAADDHMHINIPMPQFASSRTELPEDATLRPSQTPYNALAMVLKHMKDEKEHLDHALLKAETAYHAHDPAVGQRARLALSARISDLRTECERKDIQIYGLHDALEAHREEHDQQKSTTSAEGQSRGTAAGHHSLNKVSRAELAGHVSRSAPPMGLDGAYDYDNSDVGSVHLPEWDGLSEGEL